MEGLKVVKAYDQNGAVCFLMEDGRTFVLTPAVDRIDGRTYQAAIKVDVIPAQQPAQPEVVTPEVVGN